MAPILQSLASGNPVIYLMFVLPELRYSFLMSVMVEIMTFVLGACVSAYRVAYCL